MGDSALFRKHQRITGAGRRNIIFTATVSEHEFINFKDETRMFRSARKCLNKILSGKGT